MVDVKRGKFGGKFFVYEMGFFGGVCVFAGVEM